MKKLFSFVLCFIFLSGMTITSFAEIFQKSEIIYQCKSLEEYNRDYKELSKTYSAMIPFENIEFLGEFDWFGLRDDGKFKFRINCPSGGIHDLSYYPNPNGGTLDKKMRGRKLSELEAKDLFVENVYSSVQLPHIYNSCYYQLGDFYYLYSYDDAHFLQLNEIRWCNEGGPGYYSIYFHDRLGECDFCKDLVNFDRAETALNYLKNAVSDSCGSHTLLWVGIGGGAAVVIGGAVAALIVRKKRRKAATDFC